MSRRRTRKVTKAKPRTRSRTLNGGAGKRVAAAAGVAIAALVGLLAPLKPLVSRAGDWMWHSRGVRRVAGVAAGLMVLAALSWVMLDNLQDTSRYSVDPGRIELSAQPTWAKGSLADRLKAEIEDELRADLADLEPTSAFDNDVMAAVTDRLERNAWVRSVVRIERRFPTGPETHSRLLPLIEVRTPALLVQTGEDYALVDGESVVLPLSIPLEGTAFEDFRAQLAQPLRLVRGVRGRRPAPGIVWQSEQIAAALSMERVVRKAELDRTLPIDTIDIVGVPEHADERGRVMYATEGGVILVAGSTHPPATRILWGRPPVHASTLERSANDKLEDLRRRIERGGVPSAEPIDLRTGRGT
jgi:hypothetical protein